MPNALQRLENIAGMVKAYVRLVQDPTTTANTEALEASRDRLSTAADKEKMLSVFRRAKGLSEMLAGRYRPPKYLIEDLSHCPAWPPAFICCWSKSSPFRSTGPASG